MCYIHIIYLISYTSSINSEREEFSTPQKHQNLFYKVTNNSLVFYVKGEANAAVGLARAPSTDDCVYWIIIGYRNRCFIMKQGYRRKTTAIYNLLSSLEYRKFWISWKNGYIKLGRGGEQTHILSRTSSDKDLSFVTFSVFDEESNLDWKCYLPPQTLSLKPALKKIKDGKPRWVQFNKKLPEDAIIGGYENENLYIMRAFHQAALTPGKFVPSTGKGYVAWGDDAHEKNNFEIFCGYDCVWIPSHSDKIPVGAIEAGYSQVVHEIMYIGRALCEGHMIPGKIEPSHNVCYIPYNGKTVAKREYEILIDPFQANKTIIIGFQNSCFIIVQGYRCKITVTNNILSSLEYRKFWISWKNGYIKLGRGGEQTPIFSQTSSVLDLNFVTFSVFNEERNLDWKCYLPPETLSLKPAVKKVKGGKPYWVQFNKKLPEDAIIGGYENEILYIMRAFHETALTPGKFVPSTGKGYVAWGYSAHEKSKFEIFCGYDCIWIPSSGNKIPVGAIEAGYTEIGHEIMYVGRTLCEGHIIPGKIAPSHSVCYIAYDGKTVAKKEYEVLIDPFHTNKSENNFYISDLFTSHLSYGMI